jgi:hypothetical protein
MTKEELNFEQEVIRNQSIMIERLKTLLSDLVTNVDEDCPSEYRTKHLQECMSDSYSFLNNIE